MSFNPKPSKQAHEVILSCKGKRLTHPPCQTFCRKHLGVILDFKLTFEEHLCNILSSVNRAIRLLCKLCNILPRATLITIYRALIGPHLDYGDALYGQFFNKWFKEKLEFIQYNKCLALTEAIMVIPKENIYQELALESLRDRRWYRNICLFYKVLENENPKYLFCLIPNRRSLYTTSNIHNTSLGKTKYNFFKNPFFINRNRVEKPRPLS